MDFDSIKTLLIAGPGFIKDSFFNYIKQQTTTIDYSKIILINCSSAQKQVLQEIMVDPVVISKLKDSKFVQQSTMLKEFYKQLNLDNNTAFYGYDYVKYAIDLNVCKVVMVLDTCLKDLKYLKLVESSGCEVLVYSFLHESGRQLDGLGGICCLLHFGVPELEELVEQQLNKI